MNINLHNLTEYLKNGGGIHIKEKNKGSFTKYCKGKVTQECIDKAKKSGNKKLIKRAVFAENSRKWSKKHQTGGSLLNTYENYMKSQNQKWLDYTQQQSLKNAQEQINHTQKLNQAWNFGQSVGNLLGFAQVSLIPEEVEDNSRDDIPKKSVDDLAQERVNQIQKTIQKDVQKQNKEFVEKTKNTFNNTFKLPVINSTELLADDYLENITN